MSASLSEEELAARRAARQRRRAAHAVAQQLDFMYQERENYRRDAPLRRKRALARKGPSDFGLAVPELAPRPVTPVLPVGNTMTGLTTKGRKKNAALELKAAAAFLERGGKAEAVARAAALLERGRARDPAADETRHEAAIGLDFGPFRHGVSVSHSWARRSVGERGRRRTRSP